jgi:hypothetical protein
MEIERSNWELLLHPCPDFTMNPEPERKPTDERSRFDLSSVPRPHFSDDPAAHGEIVLRPPQTLLSVSDDLFRGSLHAYSFFRRSK